MLLEIDFGNTRLKWRLLDVHTSRLKITGTAVNGDDLFVALLEAGCKKLDFCRICSVRTITDNTQLARLVEHNYGIQPVFARSEDRLAGVKNGYFDTSKLGVDRWLALVAAFENIKGSCVVFDCGTAITTDYIDEAGQHLGGCIAPGLKLMSTMLRSCGGLAESESEDSEGSIVLGRTTQVAVRSGIYGMATGFIKEALELAKSNLGSGFTVFCTGGDAVLVKQVIPQAVIVNDLVFQGLAIACPFIRS